MYKVIGGVWTDTTFTEIVAGTEEEYGPFDTYDEAVKVWRGRMGWMVDTCEHRLFIVQVGLDLADAEERSKIVSQHRVPCVVNPFTGHLTNHHPIPDDNQFGYLLGNRVTDEEATHVIVTTTKVETR